MERYVAFRPKGVNPAVDMYNHYHIGIIKENKAPYGAAIAVIVRPEMQKSVD
jgi:hypothetical protein